MTTTITKIKYTLNQPASCPKDPTTTRNGRTFYIVTKLYEGEFYEQIYVEVEKKKEEQYIGRIASSPMGKVKFKERDSVTVNRKDVCDWLIVDQEGNEHGNLTGKAIEALQVGVVTFIISMTPVEGMFEEFEVVSVRNPRTQQEIKDIVSKGIIDRIEKEAKNRFGDIKTEGTETKYNYINVRFPSWELL